MRRFALLAGLITAIAAGSAAFAADTDPSPPGPAPDPLLGTWALSVDGVYAGPVASVDGCSLTADVVTQDVGKHAGNPVPALCEIEVGLGMSQHFHQWLNDALASTAHPRNVQLVRVDTKAYALDLPHTRIASVALPKIDTGARAPSYLKVGLVPEALRRRSASPLPNAPARGFSPSMLSANLDGTPLELTSVGPWKAEMRQPADIGITRDYEREPEPTEVGNLSLRAPEARIAPLDAWMQAQFVDGKADEHSLVLTLGDGRVGVDLKLGRTGLIKADLAPRADGSRAYSLYAETVALTSR